MACEPCPPAFYLYEKLTEPGSCKECPLQAFCYGRNITAPKPTYWRSSPTEERFTDCERPESCLGGDRENPTGVCAKGYEGILCSKCASGYGHSGKSECAECGGAAMNITIFAILAVLAIFLLGLLVKMTLSGSDLKRPLYQVFLKIFLNHFQILAAVSTIDFRWPNIIQLVLDTQEGVATAVVQLLSFDCIVIDLFPDR